MAPSPKQQHHSASDASVEPFSPETIQSLHELGAALRKIHNRLISEGYVIRDGKIIPPSQLSNTHNESRD